ncbi:DUF4345 domain-containing protein [Aestuariirhabdus sp. LZHN29]|uniref:DUF4345 domain-containing protein n=1 Tax=Aestuariirhabdus sp. LZHN29 TaxID=3417462 RepID=UPI003CF05F2C
MILLHKLVLYGLLGSLALSLVLPGLVELLRVPPGTPGLALETADGKNQFRALHGMMVGVGLLALWACVDLDNARLLVMAIGAVLAVSALGRGYSLWADGVPGAMSQLYLVVELVIAAVFLLWPPPV